ncbi:MAG TPA: hypothetical protein VFH10_17645 [Nocardioides sp.]|uniref:hypothetical protein n=1 Tax=Nocardioides sp. TaxID=35761 RepID=UPI002D7F6BB8|nr:hypothetical protein [Nocardioides sp.]HET6654466.1 hypothetical protein [Nocardioides sp.]
MNVGDIPVFAGVLSTVIFAGSTLPMLAKAHRTRDLASYSMGNIALANLGNAVHSAYVFSLPPGPIWALHMFYILTSATMLVWRIRYHAPRRESAARRSRHLADGRAGCVNLPIDPPTKMVGSPDAGAPAAP